MQQGRARLRVGRGRRGRRGRGSTALVMQCMMGLEERLGTGRKG